MSSKWNVPFLWLSDQNASLLGAMSNILAAGMGAVNPPYVPVWP